MLSQELRQRLRWLAGEVFERLADVIEGLIFGRASAQVAPQVGEVFHRNSVDPESRSGADPLIVGDLDITHRPAQMSPNASAISLLVTAPAINRTTAPLGMTGPVSTAAATRATSSAPTIGIAVVSGPQGKATTPARVRLPKAQVHRFS